MRKAERLFQILTVLRSRRTVITAAELADKLEVSERTIYRDVQALSLSGVPIESEAGIGYRLKPSFSVPPLMFEPEELEALMLGVRMVQGWGDQALSASADTALAKIQSVLPDSLHYSHVQQPEWLLVPKYEQNISHQYSDTLREAIKSKCVIQLVYRKQNGDLSERELWPLGLLFWGKVWTLVGWCQLRNDYRMFRLDRILNVELTDKRFHTSDELSLQHYMSLYDDCES